MRYVQKPPIVRAFEIQEGGQLPDWARVHAHAVYDMANGRMVHLVVETQMGGSVRAYPGSWLVEKGPGELVAMAPELFHQNYAPLEEANALVSEQAETKAG